MMMVSVPRRSGRSRGHLVKKEKFKVVKVVEIGLGFLSVVHNNEVYSPIFHALMKEEKDLIKKYVGKRHTKVEEDFILNDAQWDELDKILTRKKLYCVSSFEKMTKAEIRKPSVNVGVKRKPRIQPNTRNGRKTIASTPTTSKESTDLEDANLIEEEIIAKEQSELVPLLTGAKLKPYQIRGVKWLISLWEAGLNGILADPMGLGKKIQAISFLAHLKGKGLEGPYLIIAPLSSLDGWVHKITRYAPLINVVIYHGDEESREKIRNHFLSRAVCVGYPVIITSYWVAMSDMEKYFKNFRWKYVVVDNVHWLKWEIPDVLRELNLNMESKLLLTDILRKNNLTELWPLFNFVFPDAFSLHEEFESWFDQKCKTKARENDLEERRRIQVVEKISSILRPFVLQKSTTTDEKKLPQKKEIILYANMSKHQKKFQDHLVNETIEYDLHQEKINDMGVKTTESEVKSKLNNSVIAIRRNCNHPFFLREDNRSMSTRFRRPVRFPPIKQLIKQSGKLCLLDRLLSYLFRKKHKVLIISQWAEVVHMINYYFLEKNWKICTISGRCNGPSWLLEDSIKLDAFNDLSSVSRAVVITTMACKIGINLDAVDTVVIYEGDWNPQLDLEAIDRYRRITRPVDVYRLAVAKSLEARIMKRDFTRMELEEMVIREEQFEPERREPSFEVLEENEILALLEDKNDFEENVIQTDISDVDLENILDRTDLIAEHGPGWEVVRWE